MAGNTISSHPLPAFPADVPTGLANRLRESFLDYPGYYPGLVFPPYATFDDAPNWPAGWGRGATGSVGDRVAGKDLPKFWSELDLRGYRVMSRWLWDTNPFMCGFGRRLVDYHVRKGFQWQACLSGQKKVAYATAAAQKETAEGRLVTKAQNILDAWRDGVDWPMRSREGFLRLHRDGEVVQRFGSAGRDRLPWVRWVNPEQIQSPTGSTNDDDSYGLRNAPGDGEHVTAAYVVDHDDPARGEWVNADRCDPAARLVFAKTNTDADVKRGLPDSFSCHEYLDECRKLVRNLVVTACAQAAIAWREKFASATGDQVRALIPTTMPDPRSPSWMTGGQTIYSEKIPAGTVVRTEGTREFEPGPTAGGVPGFVEAEQAALRAACVRWGLPPYMTAKADDINFASSLTSGSPFAVAVEGGQVEWCAYERRTALKVLDLATEAGLLTWAERRMLDVHVVEPTVITPDPAAATQRRKTMLDAKIVDPYTVMQEEGYDPSHIEANWKAWNERNPQPQQPPPGQQPPGAQDDDGGGGDGGGDPLASLMGEAVARPGDMLHLLAAVLAAHARGDEVDADAVADLAHDPAALADLIGDLSGGVAESVARLWEKWSPFKTRSGATGATDGGRKLYGKAATRALAQQDRADKGEPEPEHPARKLAKDLKAQREPKRDEARRALAAALKDPGAVTAAHVAALAEHLPALTRDEARAALKSLGKQVGGKLKVDIVRGLLDHVTAATEPAEPTDPDPEPAKPPEPAGGGVGAGTAEPAGKPAALSGDEPWHVPLKDFMAGKKDEAGDFSARILATAKPGNPGLESTDAPERFLGKVVSPGHKIVYRDPQGKPVAVAKLGPDRFGRLGVVDLATDKGRGVLAARAAVEIGREIIRLGAARPTTTISRDAARLLHHAAVRQAVERGEPVPPDVLADYPALAKSVKPTDPDPEPAKPPEPAGGGVGADTTAAPAKPAAKAVAHTPDQIKAVYDRAGDLDPRTGVKAADLHAVYDSIAAMSNAEAARVYQHVFGRPPAVDKKDPSRADARRALHRAIRDRRGMAVRGTMGDKAGQREFDRAAAAGIVHTGEPHDPFKG